MPSLHRPGACKPKLCPNQQNQIKRGQINSTNSKTCASQNNKRAPNKNLKTHSKLHLSTLARKQADGQSLKNSRLSLLVGGFK